MKDLKVGSVVVYGTNGVCTVEPPQTRSFNAEDKLYYVLKPLSSTASTYFIPCDNTLLRNKIREVYTKEQIDSIILGSKNEQVEWNDDRRRRDADFREIAGKGITSRLLSLVHCIYLKGEELKEKNKRLNTSDEMLMKKSEALVNEEFSYALGISAQNVGDYIRNILGTGC